MYPYFTASFGATVELHVLSEKHFIDGFLITFLSVWLSAKVLFRGASLLLAVATFEAIIPS